MEMNKTLLREVFEQVQAEAHAEDCHWKQATWLQQRMSDADVEEVHLNTNTHGPEDVLLVTPNCGTAMCFAGWATVVGDPGSRFILDDDTSAGVAMADRVLLTDGSVRNISSAAEEMLGIGWADGSRLFDGDNTLEDLRTILTEWGVLA